MDLPPRIAVVTFATSLGDKPFKNYILEIERLKASLSNFEVDFHIYTLKSLKQQIRGTPFRSYPRFRKGVGGWFWKPLVILDYLKDKQYDYVIYVDVDCVFLKDPITVIESLPKHVEFAGFRMNAQIGEWTAERIIDNLGASDLKEYQMWTAGILIIKNTNTARDYLTLWSNLMSDPCNLFESPFDPDKSRHRHDQSLLSILIARNKIEMYNLGPGFYSEGIEATSKNLEDAWIATGVNFGIPPVISQMSIVSRTIRAINHRVVNASVATFWFFFFPSYFFGKNKR